MKTVLWIVLNIVALCVMWDMALDRLAAHYDRWHDDVDVLLGG